MASQLVLVDVLLPVVRALRHDAQDVLGHEVGREPAHPGARNGAHDEPAAGLDERRDLVQEGGRVRDVLEHLEHGDDVVLVFWQRQRLDRSVDVVELPRQARVPARMALGYRQHFRRRVNGCDALGA